MTKKERIKEEERKGMVEYFNKLTPRRDNKIEVYSVIRHVSKSGMTRFISFHVVASYLDERYLGNITKSVGRLLDLPYSEKHQGLRVTGCGMDMAFNTVYNLSHEIYGDGYRLHSTII